jgi:hypothetical protein
MRFSTFEFRPTESFHYGGYVIWTVQKQEARDTVLDRWSHTHAKWVPRKNVYSSGNISIISDIIQIVQ